MVDENIQKNEEIINDEVVVKKSKNFQKFVRIVSAVLFLATIVILVIVANASEKFTLKPALWIGAGSFVFFTLIFFSFTFKKWIQKIKEGNKGDSKIPEPVTENQAYELVCNKFKTKLHADYIEEVYDGGVESRGKVIKQFIYFLYFKSLFSQQDYFVGLNMHYPEKGIRVIKNPKPNELILAKKRLVHGEQEESPDIEETSVINPLTGGVVTSKKVTHKKLGRPKLKKEGDLK